MGGSFVEVAQLHALHSGLHSSVSGVDRSLGIRGRGHLGCYEHYGVRIEGGACLDICKADEEQGHRRGENSSTVVWEKQSRELPSYANAVEFLLKSGEGKTGPWSHWSHYEGS